MLKEIWRTIKSILEPIAKIISAIVNFVLLVIVYFLSIGPVSVIAKLFGKHFLQLKNQNKKSNWQEHFVTKQQLEKYYRTF